MKKIFNYIMLFASVLSGLSLTACSDEALDTNQYNKSGVNILAFGPMPITRGETMRLTGTKLDKVKEVLFPEGNQKLVASKTYIQGEYALSNSEEMTVTIPDMCVPGKLRLVTNDNDTIVSSSNITFVEEIKATSISPAQVHPGDIVSIKGEYVWNIASVTFAAGVKVEAEDFILNTRKEIQVRVPKDAISGSVTYNDGAEGSEDVVITENLIVDAAKAISLSNPTPDFNEQIIIYGENLDLVRYIEFPSIAATNYTIAADGKSITVTVPEYAVSGDIVLTSYSGLTTSVEVTLPLVSYEAGSISPVKNLKAGQTVTLKGYNLDRVAMLFLPGDITLEKGQFTQSKTEISFVVPENMGDGKVTLYQHHNHTVETERITMYAEDGPVKIIWRGSKALAWSGEGQVYLGSDGGQELIDAGAKAGDKLRLAITSMSNDWVVQIWDGHWTNQFDEIKAENYDLTAEGGYYVITLTDELIKQFTTVQNWGSILVVQGQDAYVTELALVQKSDEKTLWTGELIADEWKNQPYALSDAGQELKDANAKVGQKINFYITPMSSTWKLEIVEGHWGPTYVSFCGVGADTEGGKFTEWNLDENGGKVSITLTQAMLDAAYTQQWWGGVFVLNGDDVKCTKITLQ